MTGIRKKNRRNVQKRITDAKGFRGEQTKKERKKREKEKKKKEEEKEEKKEKKKKKSCQQHPVFPGGHPSKY